jgi:hypothetical protein
MSASVVRAGVAIVLSLNIAPAGPSPIPALTRPDTPELGLPSTHSYGYGFRSSPAFSRICPASVSRMTASGMLVHYSG